VVTPNTLKYSGNWHFTGRCQKPIFKTATNDDFKFYILDSEISAISLATTTYFNSYFYRTNDICVLNCLLQTTKAVPKSTYNYGTQLFSIENALFKTITTITNQLGFFYYTSNNPTNNSTGPIIQFSEFSLNSGSNFYPYLPIE
jgi:hypothetical protein